MINLASALPVIVITVLTVLLTIIGFYIVIVLRDFRYTLKRVNAILDQSENILHKFSNPTQNLGGIVSGLREGLKIVDTVTHLLSNRRQQSSSPYAPDAL